MPYNPAWVCHSDGGTEFQLFSVSGLAGTNAYTLSKGWLTRTVTGQHTATPVEDQDYVKDPLKGYKKYIWGNADVLGPAVSFRLRPNIFIGLYTRARQLANGGNLTRDALSFIGDQQHVSFGQQVRLSKAGFTLHAFTEAGITYGAILKDNGYHRWHAGVTVKYLTGLAAASVYANDVDMQLEHLDSTARFKGDLSVKYSESLGRFTGKETSSKLSSWLDGGQKHSLGLDMGIQYEYHPDYSPNYETPYLFSFAASVTDIGGIWYRADTGSAMYELEPGNSVDLQYRSGGQPGTSGGGAGPVNTDTLVKKKENGGAFRVGMPTAFRFNADLQLGDGFALAANILINLQSTRRGIYNPGYANTFCLTPRYERKKWMIGIPFCFVRHQQMTVGAVIRTGPVFIGSASVITCAISNHVNTLDGYAGVSFTFKRRKQYY